MLFFLLVCSLLLRLLVGSFSLSSIIVTFLFNGLINALGEIHSNRGIIGKSYDFGIFLGKVS